MNRGNPERSAVMLDVLRRYPAFQCLSIESPFLQRFRVVFSCNADVLRLESAICVGNVLKELVINCLKAEGSRTWRGT
jgi:hypothetical protein